MYCVKCGSILKDEAKYCGKCGAFQGKEYEKSNVPQTEKQSVNPSLHKKYVTAVVVVIGCILAGLMISLLFSGNKKELLCDTWYVDYDGEFEEAFTLYEDGSCDGIGEFDNAHWNLENNDTLIIITEWGDYSVYNIKKIKKGILVMTYMGSKGEICLYGESKVKY